MKTKKKCLIKIKIKEKNVVVNLFSFINLKKNL